MRFNKIKISFAVLVISSFILTLSSQSASANIIRSQGTRPGIGFTLSSPTHGQVVSPGGLMFISGVNTLTFCTDTSGNVPSGCIMKTDFANKTITECGVAYYFLPVGELFDNNEGHSGVFMANYEYYSDRATCSFNNIITVPPTLSPGNYVIWMYPIWGKLATEPNQPVIDGTNFGAWGEHITLGTGVDNSPMLNFTADDHFVVSGSNTRLRWQTYNVDSCTASGGWDGSKNTGNKNQSVGPINAPTTFTLTCSGPNGTIARSVVVNTEPAVTGVDIKANDSDGPIEVVKGSNVAISWTSQNATSCTITSIVIGVGGINTVQKSPSGSYNTPLTGTTVYTLNCTNAVSSASDNVRVNAIPAPPTVSISANPNSIAYNTASTLSWTASYATVCTASGDWSGNKSTSGGSQSTGNLISSQTYTITCDGEAGSNPNRVNDSVTVAVTPAPTPIVSISASPNPVNYGSGSTLVWSVSNANSCVASGDWSGNKSSNGGSQPINNLTSAKTYTITCTGSGGSDTDSVTVNIIPLPACNDNNDNDNDGFTDFPADPGCSTSSDTDEFNPPPPACSDGSDNDNDGFTDMTDPDCTDPSDTNESSQMPDLIVSVAPSLNSGTLTEGFNATFKAKIKNIGDTLISNTFARFYVDLNNDGSLNSEITPAQTVSSLMPGVESSFVVSGTWTAIAGTHRIVACADDPVAYGANINLPGDVQELLETNNCSNRVRDTDPTRGTGIISVALIREN